MWHPIALLHVGARLSWTTFTVHWSTVIGIAALGALYAWRGFFLPGEIRRPARLQAACFIAALVLLFFSLNGWLHDLSDGFLFSAHMVQYLLLAMVDAPLLVMCVPGWMVRPALRIRAIAAFGRACSNPIVAFAVFNVV